MFSRFSNPIRIFLRTLVCVATIACPTAVLALTEAQPLRVGEFRWADGAEVGAPDDLAITISIAQQRLYVYRAGMLVAMSTVSTGSRGHATPLGEFSILQKRQWHRSNLYSNAPMPFMQRLTWTGIAIHAGHLPGYPASHGCIRLPLAFAKQLFAITALGVPVTIVGEKREPLVKLRFADLDWMAGDEVVTFQPSGPAQLIPASARIVDDQRQPTLPYHTGPHWAAPSEIDAVRQGAAPKLPFEMVPE